MRLARTFERLRSKGELALIPYMTAGFPSLTESLSNLSLLSKHGADILEVGIPFSDPVADGPTIQYSSQVALDGGFRLPDMLAALKGLDLACPLVAMSYLNPLMPYPKETLLREMKACGISGLIVPDLPVEESDEWLTVCRACEITLVFLVAPTSSPERVHNIARHSDCFLYYVSLTGTTGSRDQLPRDLTESLTKLKAVTSLPVAVGFGISQPGHIRRLHGLADGAVVGSRIVEAVRGHEDLVQLMGDLKDATKESLPC